MTVREIKFFEAIREATQQMMRQDSNVIAMGLGVPDPKGIFGTTLGLIEEFGKDRVFDMPIAENALTGILTGAAIGGLKPIMTHQRVDFFLLAFDQLVNNAAKWHYMYARKMNVPMVFRLIIGRGWGQGPQHFQSMQSVFAHIPGLKVVMPATAYDAKGLLIASIKDNNPVVFLEHRWLHNTTGFVPEDMYEVEIGKAKVIKEGNDVTFVTASYMTIEALKAAQLLEKEGISVEIVDLRSIKPLDVETICKSAAKTGRVIIGDLDWKTCGLAGEIMAVISENVFHHLKKAPVRVTYEDRFCPTSWALANHFYPTHLDLVQKGLEIMDKPKSSYSYIASLIEERMQKPLDTPDLQFQGPF